MRPMATKSGEVGETGQYDTVESLRAAPLDCMSPLVGLSAAGGRANDDSCMSAFWSLMMSSPDMEGVGGRRGGDMVLVNCDCHLVETRAEDLQKGQWLCARQVTQQANSSRSARTAGSSSGERRLVGETTRGDAPLKSSREEHGEEGDFSRC